MSQNGCVKEAYDLLLKEDFPSWLYQVKAGATTVWEHWDGLKPDGSMWSPDMNSFNHYAYGAIGEWMYRVIAGIEIDEESPGYRHAILAPKTDSRLSWAEGSYDSVYGSVSLRWEETAGRITVTVCVPVNTTVSLILEPGASDIRNGRLNKKEIVFTERKDGTKQAELGSGTWMVSYMRAQETAGM